MSDDKPKTPPEEPILDDQGYPRRCRGLEPLGAILPDVIKRLTERMEARCDDDDAA